MLENNSKQTEGKTTRSRIEKTIDVLKLDLHSVPEDYVLIEDIIALLSKEEYMSSTRAQSILEDAKKVIPYISEVRLL